MPSDELRKSIASAFDAASSDDADNSETSETAQEVEDQSGASAQGSVEPAKHERHEVGEDEKEASENRSKRDTKGRFSSSGTGNRRGVKTKPVVGEDAQGAAKKSSGEGETTEPGKPAQPPAPAAPDARTQQQPEQPAIKAPMNWKATVREHWSKLPVEVQREVVRRESEMAMALQQSAAVRKEHEAVRQEYNAFRQQIAPYEGLIRSEGSTPTATISSLLQTYGALHMAAPATKASIVANMVRTFGVDIGMLDQALSGQTTGNANQGFGSVPNHGIQHQANPQQFRDPRFDQFMSQIQAAQQQRAQAIASDAQSETSRFGEGHEFFEDVRQDMADIIEMGMRRNVKITMDEAYDRACHLRPEIRQVMQQRDAAKNAASTRVATQRSLSAASSVRSSPSNGVSVPEQPKDLYGQISAAWDSMAGVD